MFNFLPRDLTTYVLTLSGGAVFSVLGDLWELRGVAWKRVEPASEPEALLLTTAAYHVAKDQVVRFGGASIFTNAFSDATWVFDGIDWKEANPTGRGASRSAAP